MADFDDGYAGYYAQRLWALLPEVYRTDDTDPSGAPGPLHELLNRVGGQAAVVRRSLDRLWADQSIETCDDWVIPYIGDLLATNLIGGLDPRGQRLDVAKTIYYRRRKGTLALLEELAHDITGCHAHLMEGFRRLARTRHGLDPMIGRAAFPQASSPQITALLSGEGLLGALTATPAGGLADLRHRHGAALTDGPFDESYHSADLRAGRGALGHFSIPKLLVFLWRLTSFAIDAATPVAVAGCPGHYVFDPTGREIPLFLPPPTGDDTADTWTAAHEWQVPGPITTSLEQAITAPAGTAPPAPPYPNPPPAPTPASSPPTGTPAPYGYTINGAQLDHSWPEQGRFQIAASSPPTPAAALRVSYCYGFSAGLPTLYVGAGPYPRAGLGDPPQPPSPPITTLRGGTGLAGALANLAPTGTVILDDSLTYPDPLPPVGSPTAPLTAVLIAAGDQHRPVLRPPPASPPENAPTWVFTGAPGAQLTLDGLLISGCDIVLRGAFDTVRITACTLDPGTAHRFAPPSPPPATPLASAADGRPLRPTTLWIEADPNIPPGSPPATSPPASTSAAIRELRIDHSILGPIRTRYGGTLETLTLTDSIVQAIPTTTGPDYTPPDIYDPGLLAAALAAANPLAHTLAAALPGPARTALSDYQPPAPAPQALIDGLNQLVNGPPLFDPALFATVALPPDLAALATTAPSPPSPATAILNRALLDAALPVALGAAAIAVRDATISAARIGVLGALSAHRLHLSNSIVTGFTTVDDTQHGCVRFSAYPAGSRIPRPYQSVTIGAHASLFTSTDYGQPGYAQLHDAADHAITGPPGTTISAGADTGSQMGAFCAALAPIKEHALLTKYAEYMPLGLTPVIIHVT